jgi:predicted dehydrogenase
MSAIRIALVGLGKISVDQHLPSIAGDAAFALVGGVSPRSRIAGVPAFEDLATLFAATEVEAVAINIPQ